MFEEWNSHLYQLPTLHSWNYSIVSDQKISRKWQTITFILVDFVQLCNNRLSSILWIEDSFGRQESIIWNKCLRPLTQKAILVWITKCHLISRWQCHPFGKKYPFHQIFAVVYWFSKYFICSYKMVGPSVERTTGTCTVSAF